MRQDHLMACPYRKVRCPHPSCEKRVMASELPVHLLECSIARASIEDLISASRVGQETRSDGIRAEMKADKKVQISMRKNPLSTEDDLY